MPDFLRWKTFDREDATMTSLALSEREQETEERERIGRWVFAIVLVLGTALTSARAIEYAHGHPLSLLIGASLALPAAFVYAVVPRLFDRYDPEPWPLLFACLVFGFFVGPGVALWLHEGFAHLGAFLGLPASSKIRALLYAPLAEELVKAAMIYGIFRFVRREFDGVVDGIIYASFAALGFAAAENALYYAKAHQSSHDLPGVWILRSVAMPWAHPFFSSFVGIAFGLVRENPRRDVKRWAPLAGLSLAVLFHSFWNAGTFRAPSMQHDKSLIFVLSIWVVAVASFFLVLARLVARRSAILRTFLRDEVALGTLSQDELEVVCHAFGRLHARLSRGNEGELFVRLSARLAVAKWHSSRANQQGTETVSEDLVHRRRRQLKLLRKHMTSNARQSN